MTFIPKALRAVYFEEGNRMRVFSHLHRIQFLLLAAIVGSLWVGAELNLRAQGTSYITGTVLDPNQNPVPNAPIQIKNEVTLATFAVKTTDTGLYRSPALDPGSYTVRVSAPSF